MRQRITSWLWLRRPIVQFWTVGPGAAGHAAGPPVVLEIRSLDHVAGHPIAHSSGAATRDNSDAADLSVFRDAGTMD